MTLYCPSQDNRSQYSNVFAGLHLRQHGILPPPGQADGEQIIDGRGILQTGLASFSLVRKSTDDRFTAGLQETQTGSEEGEDGGGEGGREEGSTQGRVDMSFRNAYMHKYSVCVCVTHH